MGKRNEQAMPDYIQSATPMNSQSRFKRPRVDTTTDEVALSLLFMRSHTFPQELDVEENSSISMEDVTQVTDDEDDSSPNSRLVIRRPPSSPTLPGPIGMPLSRPPKLPRVSKMTHNHLPKLPEGRPLPPSPVLPRLNAWSAVLSTRVKA